MYKRLNELNFVIGVFFTLVSVILLLDNFLGKGSHLNLYTGLAFLVFGILMIMLKTGNSD